MNSIQEIQQFIHSSAFNQLSDSLKQEIKEKENSLILNEIHTVAKTHLAKLAKEHGEPIRICMSLEMNGEVKVEYENEQQDDVQKEAILTHPLDWSPFEYGFTIDRKYHQAIFDVLGQKVPKGGFLPVIIEYDGEEFNAVIDNPDVKARKVSVIRLLYRGPRKIGNKLKENFPDTYQYIKNLKDEHGGRYQVKLPEELKATISLFVKEKPARFTMDCTKV